MIRPTRNAAATREKMLASARRHFLQESYENVGLRDIAADAGVDVALVARYFGSKAGLFREVIRKDKAENLKDIPRGSLARWMAEMATSEPSSDDSEHIEGLLMILRSASSPEAARIVSEAFRDDVLGPFSDLLEGGDREVRASLALSLLIGTTVLRTIMRVEAVCGCDVEPMRSRLEAMLDVALNSGKGTD